MDPMDLTIQAARGEELAQCAQVIAAAFDPIAQTYGFRPTAQLDALIGSLRDLPDPEDRVYSIWKGGTQVGCFVLARRDEGGYEITKLSVLPEHQRQGIGQQMLEQAFELIGVRQGVAAVCAVFNADRPVKQWLMKNGFREVVSGCVAGVPCAVCMLQKQFETACGGCG